MNDSTMVPALAASKTLPPQLTPKINRPLRMPKAVDAWNTLQRIKFINVVPQHDSERFEIQIYLHHSQSRIPTNRNRRTPPLSSAALLNSIPDRHVLSTEAELTALQQQVWTAIRHYHPVYCTLCSGLRLQLLPTIAQPSLFTAVIHRSAAKRANKLQSFLIRLLMELHEKKPLCVAACTGQRDLPILLHAFLLCEEVASVEQP